MIYITFDPFTPHFSLSDHEASKYWEYVDRLIKMGDGRPYNNLTCCNWLCILSIRVAVKSGLLNHLDVVFQMDGKTVYIDENGELFEYTLSMDYFTNLLIQLA